MSGKITRRKLGEIREDRTDWARVDAMTEEELELLKTVKRKEIAERIRASKEFGDISENAEYEDAKNEQAFVEGRIQQLDAMLRTAKVIDNHDAPADEITVGKALEGRREY